MNESSESRPTVLIVDDESGIVDTLRILLKNEGFAAHVAFGGKQGLDQIAALQRQGGSLYLCVGGELPAISASSARNFAACCGWFSPSYSATRSFRAARRKLMEGLVCLLRIS